MCCASVWNLIQGFYNHITGDTNTLHNKYIYIHIQGHMLQNISIYLTNQPNSMQQSQSSEANCSVATQEIPHVLWKLQVPYSFQ